LVGICVVSLHKLLLVFVLHFDAYQSIEKGILRYAVTQDYSADYRIY
jgi:hypothetical protein